MKTELDLTSISKGLTGFFRRFHTLLFFVVASAGLFAAIVMLLNIITLSSTEATSSDQAVNGSFDDATIEQLKKSESTGAGPTGRVSPFVE